MVGLPDLNTELKAVGTDSLNRFDFHPVPLGALKVQLQLGTFLFELLEMGVTMLRGTLSLCTAVHAAVSDMAILEVCWTRVCYALCKG